MARNLRNLCTRGGSPAPRSVSRGVCCGTLVDMVISPPRTFAFIHGAGDVGWYWHLVEAELRAQGHDTVARIFPSRTMRPDCRPTRTSWLTPSPEWTMPS